MERPKVTDAQHIAALESAILLLLTAQPIEWLERLRANHVNVLALNPGNSGKAGALEYVDFLLAQAQAIQHRRQ